MSSTDHPTDRTHAVTDRLQRAVDTAATTRLLRRVDRFLAVVTAHSLLVTTFWRCVRGSRFYGWLTSPPDGPVLDLRDSRLCWPVVCLARRTVAGLARAWEHALVAPLVAELRWKLRHRPGRVLGGLLAALVFVEYARLFYPGIDSSVGSLGRGLLIVSAIFFLRLRLPPGTVARSRTVGFLRAVFVAPADSTVASESADE